MWQPWTVVVAVDMADVVAVEDGEDVGDMVDVVVAVADAVVEAVLVSDDVPVVVGVVGAKQCSNWMGHLPVLFRPTQMPLLCLHGPVPPRHPGQVYSVDVVAVDVVVDNVKRWPPTQGANPTPHVPSARGDVQKLGDPSSVSCMHVPDVL